METGKCCSTNIHEKTLKHDLNSEIPSNGEKHLLSGFCSRRLLIKSSDGLIWVRRLTEMIHGSFPEFGFSLSLLMSGRELSGKMNLQVFRPVFSFRLRTLVG